MIVKECVSSCTDLEQDLWSQEQGKYTSLLDMKEKLKFHFMNPVDKWKEKKRFSGKLLLHVLSVILITTQVMVDLTKNYFATYMHAGMK